MIKLYYYLDLILVYLLSILKIVMYMKHKQNVNNVMMVMNLIMINNVNKFLVVNFVYKNLIIIVLNV